MGPPLHCHLVRVLPKTAADLALPRTLPLSEPLFSFCEVGIEICSHGYCEELHETPAGRWEARPAHEFFLRT